VGQFEISAYNPRDHQADQTYHKYDNAKLWRNARHPEGNSYSYEEKCPPVDVPHSSKLIITNDYFIQTPHVIADGGLPSWRPAQRLVNPTEVVIHTIQRQSMFVILKFF
jgi:hypothetical protein